MNVILTKDYASMSRLAASLLAAEVVRHPDAVLGLATGSTPVGMYQELVRLHREAGLSFSSVHSVNLDEYEGLAGDHEQSYRAFMQKNLFDHVDIPRENTNVPSGQNEDVEAACAAYEDLIRELGGIDLQVLGLGHDGHIGFNEPAETFPAVTHRVQLEAETREANARFFSSIDEVPTHAVTMGIGTIMRARKILLLVSGADKHEILQRTLYGEVHPRVPASILQFHPDVTVLADEAAWNGK